MPQATERMSRVDTAWLRMDNDVNLMTIVGIWLLTPAITLQDLRRRIEERGTRNFPEANGRKLYGELTMNVTVDAAGRVVEAFKKYADVMQKAGYPYR